MNCASLTLITDDILLKYFNAFILKDIDFSRNSHEKSIFLLSLKNVENIRKLVVTISEASYRLRSFAIYL